MRKTTKVEAEVEMAKFVCNSVSDVSKTALQKSVEQVIRKNKKVFDNLAKS
jgi:hypothetical protein